MDLPYYYVLFFCLTGVGLKFVGSEMKKRERPALAWMVGLVSRDGARNV